MTTIIVFLLLAAFLIFLNAFFVLAEFAAVKARTTQMEVLVARGDARAKKFKFIQTHLDRFLSVCQIGITFASIGLGFVGEPALARLVQPALHAIGLGKGSEAIAHGIAVTIAYLLISFLHIVIGEQVPKLVAIRKTESTALLTAYPMIVFYYLFYLPLWLLNSTVNAVLRLLRINPLNGPDRHSEHEVRIILSQSQSGGIMSFRRLLYMENILDLGGLTVRNAMRVRRQVHSLQAAAGRAENDRVITESRHSRFPIIGADPERPIGYIHVKDLLLAEKMGKSIDELTLFTRPCLVAKEGAPLEPLLSEMQRKGNHLALVYDDRGHWTGIITLEDIVEEIIGTVEDEFPLEPAVGLSDFLSEKRVLLDVEGDTITDATRTAVERIDKNELPLAPAAINRALAERERLGSSFVGKRLAIPHARLKNITNPVVIVARLKAPIPAPVADETIDILFILLTPESLPRVHQMLLSHIAGIFTSEFLETRLTSAASSAELLDAIRVAEQAALA